MDRRTFVLLTSAVSAWTILPPYRHSALPPGRAGRQGVGRLRFELDDQRRWSLWYQAEAEPVLLLEHAVLGAWVGDALVTLADLEDISTGNRRPPGAESLLVRGRGAASGVYVEAEFVASRNVAAPQAGVRVSVYPDRFLATIGGVRFFTLPEAQVMPADGGHRGHSPLLALVNGYTSRDASRLTIVSAADMPELTSHGALGLTRDGRWGGGERGGLAVAFDWGEPGDGKVKLSKDGLEAVSEWHPARPVRPDGDTSTIRFCFLPDGDGLEALRALFVPSSPVDRERLASAAVPAGWGSRSELSGRVTEEDMIANLEFCATHFDQRFFRYLQLDDGYQRAAGDWEMNAKFPHGHRWLTDQIQTKGFRAGLWLAPFAVAERSGLPATHPEWLLKDAGGPIVWDTRDDWGGQVYALDGAHPAVQEWLYNLARRVVREWGYDFLKADLPLWATAGLSHYGGLTHAEAFRRGLSAIRDGLGTEAFLLGSGAPLQHAAGLVNGMRIGPDVEASWAGLREPARAAALRSFYHRSSWLNDPDCLLVRPPLSETEAQAWAAIVAVSGGMTLMSDHLPRLPPERIPILQRVIPVATGGGGGRPLGAALGDGAIATWVVEGAPQWWTVVVVNWEDIAREVSLPLAALGLSGERFNAYDVWRDVPRPDLRQHLATTLAPHSALTLGVRARSRRPQVIGTTRHVVQGAVDLAEERWDPATRTLSARSTALDGRAYAVTIAVPAGLRLGACQADLPCTVKRLQSGHAVLAWAAGSDGRDISWRLSFRTASSSQE